MKPVLAVALAALVCGPACARGRLDRPVLSCNKAPLLAVFQRQLPDHVLATTADTQPKITSALPPIAGSLYRRARTDLVCVVLALDATGKVQTAEVSYPAGVRLTSQERAQVLATQWSPAKLKGQPRPSLVNMDFKYETR
ncbi:hypothetical protein [Frateuria sp. YIM B11624]|uniref:hypothetical protein n=1 Tax=Frateuria sp. YIM B11624 TaxID=3143185 RepID=UPI003C77A35D